MVFSCLEQHFPLILVITFCACFGSTYTSNHILILFGGNISSISCVSFQPVPTNLLVKFPGPRDRRKRLTTPSWHQELMKGTYYARSVLGSDKTTRISPFPVAGAEELHRPGQDIQQYWGDIPDKGKLPNMLPGAGRGPASGTSTPGTGERQPSTPGGYGKQSLFWSGSSLWVQQRSPLLRGQSLLHITCSTAHSPPALSRPRTFNEYWA